VVHDSDLVRERVRLLEVLRGEQHGRTLGDQVADDLPHVLALGRVETGGRLVEEDHRGSADERRRQVEPASHATRVGLRRTVGGRTQVEPLEQLSRPPLCVASREVEQLPDEHEVLPAGEVLVDRGVLAGQPDLLADPVRIARHVEPGHLGKAGIGSQQGGQDAHRGGLPGAVRAEHAEHGALPGEQVHAVEGERVAEALDQSVSLNRVCHGDSVGAGPGTARTRRWQRLSAAYQGSHQRVCRIPTHG